MILPKSDRTRAMERRYQQDKISKRVINLLDEPVIRAFGNWRIISNRYPYDKAWHLCEMLVYTKPFQWGEIPNKDMKDFYKELPNLLAEYDAIRINSTKLQSVKNIPHIHLFKGVK